MTDNEKSKEIERLTRALREISAAAHNSFGAISPNGWIDPYHLVVINKIAREALEPVEAKP